MPRKPLALVLCLLLCFQPFPMTSLAAVLTGEDIDGLPSIAVVDVTDAQPPSDSASPDVPEVPADPTSTLPRDESADSGETLLTDNDGASMVPVDPPVPGDEQPLSSDPTPFAQGYARVLARVEVKLAGGTKAELLPGNLVYADGLDADGTLTVWFALPGGDVVKTQLDAAQIQPLAEEEAEAFLLATQEAEKDGQACARTPQGVALPVSGKHLVDAPKKQVEDAEAQPHVRLPLPDEASASTQSRGVLTIHDITVDRADVTMGDTLTWTMTASGGEGELLYNFSIYNENNVPVLIGVATPEPTITYTPEAPGYYIAVGVVTDAQWATAVGGGGLAQVLSADPLTIQRIDANRSSVQLGEALTWTMTTSGGTGDLLYNFSIYNHDNVPVFIGEPTSEPTITYTPTEPGYYVAVGVVTDSLQSVMSNSWAVRVLPSTSVAIQSIEVDRSTVEVGEPLTWTMTAVGGMAPLRYRFSIYNHRNEPVFFRVPSSEPTITYTPTAPGYYVAVGIVGDAQGESVMGNGGLAQVLPTNPPTIQSIDVNKTAAHLGEILTWTMTTSGGTGALHYSFCIFNQDNVPVFIGESSPEPTVTFTPTVPGYYIAVGIATDAQQASATGSGGLAQMLPTNPPTIQSIEVDKSTVQFGEALTWTMTTSGGTGELLYHFSIYNQDNVPVLIGKPTPDPTITYTPTMPGYYIAVGVVTDAQHARDMGGAGLAQVLPTNPPTIQSIDANKTAAYLGETLTWTMTTTGGQAPLQYSFSIYNHEGTAMYVSGPTNTPTISYTPPASGYYVAVGVVTDDYRSTATANSEAVAITAGIVLTDPGPLWAYNTFTWETLVDAGTPDITYTYDIYRRGERVRTFADSVSSTLSYSPGIAGVYQIVVTTEANGQVLSTVASDYCYLFRGEPQIKLYGGPVSVRVAVDHYYGNTTSCHIFREEYGQPSTRTWVGDDRIGSGFSALSFFDDDISTGKVYKYSIQAYEMFNGVCVDGVEMDGGYIFCATSPAMNLTQYAQSSTEALVHVQWSAEPMAHGYVVERFYRQAVEGLPYTLGETIITTDTVLQWSVLPQGTQQAFAIIPYFGLPDGTRVTPGGPDEHLAIIVIFDAPKGVSLAQVGDTAMQVSWEGPPDVNDEPHAPISYVTVSRATSIAGPYTRVGTAPRAVSSYIDTDLVPGQTYYYMLYAVHEPQKHDTRDYGTIIGLPSTVVSATLQPAPRTIVCTVEPF